MNSFLGSYDHSGCRKLLRTLKDEQKILKLEEMIDNERMVRQKLEQEAKLLVILVKNAQDKKGSFERRRSGSVYSHYEEGEFKEKAYARNTIMSTSYRD